jgi:hypothetical protein
MRILSLEACQRWEKIWKTLVERGKKDGVGEEKREGEENIFPTKREKRIREMRYFPTQNI